MKHMQVMVALRAMFPDQTPTLVRVYRTAWHRDPFAQGALVYPRVGFQPKQDWDRLWRPFSWYGQNPLKLLC
jgi:hypothetical protein